MKIFTSHSFAAVLVAARATRHALEQPNHPSANSAKVKTRRRAGWPESELDELVRARADALACFWTREGPRDAVPPSPDIALRGGKLELELGPW